MKKIVALTCTFALAIVMSGCLSPSGTTASEQKSNAEKMVSETLKELYRFHPLAKNVVDKSAGYVIFSDLAIDLIFFPTEFGYAVAKSNSLMGKTTILSSLSLGIGPGIGVSFMRNILIFESKVDFERFVRNGWALDVKADAVARFSDESNAQAAVGFNFTNRATYYKIGERGLIAEAVLIGTKAWHNAELNN